MSEKRRTVRVGSITVVACHDDGDLGRLGDWLRDHGHAIERTAHFLVGKRPDRAGTVVLHALAEADVDEDLAPVVAAELGPAGAVASADEYGRALFAIVASTCPRSLTCARCGRLHLDDPALLRHYALNTLRRLRAPEGGGSHVARFRAIYRRTVDCLAGDSLLDVGTNLGLLPVLAAERAGTIVACDLRPEAVRVAADLAAAAGHRHIRFAQRDVRADDFRGLGVFDTVTAIHLLEHFGEGELPLVLSRLLAVTGRRLIVAVPFEDPVQPLYGHRQAFTPETLRRWGAWCAERLVGGSFRCEDVSGGFLVVDRPQYCSGSG